VPRPRQVSDADILSAARSCFLEHGPSVSTTLIAERAGLSQGALFKRFGTKDDLMLAALIPPRHPVLDVLAHGPDDSRDIRDQLVEIAQALLPFFETVVPSTAVLRCSGLSTERLYDGDEVPGPVKGQRALAGWLACAQRRGLIGPADPEALAFSFLGALHMRAFMSHVLGEPVSARTHRQYAEDVTDLLWNGIAPEQEVR